MYEDRLEAQDMPFHCLLTYPILFTVTYFPVLCVPVVSGMSLQLFLLYFVQLLLPTLLVSRSPSDVFFFAFSYGVFIILAILYY